MKISKNKIMPFYYLGCLILLIGTLSLVLYTNSSRPFLNQYPKLILFLFGFPFSKLMGHLQLSHLAHSEFDQFRKTICFFCVVFIIISSLSYFNIDMYSNFFNLDMTKFSKLLSSLL